MPISLPPSGDIHGTGAPRHWVSELSDALNPRLPHIPRRECEPNAKCCEKSDLKTRRECNFCTAPCCNYCRGLYNGRWICKPCRDLIKTKLDAEKATWNDFPRALLGGFGFAVIGGLFWSLFAIWTQMKVGILAVVLGLLAGFGAHFGTGAKRGFPIQIAATLCGMLSILLGQYVISMYFSGSASYFNRACIAYFFTHLFDFMGIFDICCLAAAMIAAFLVAKPRLASVR